MGVAWVVALWMRRSSPLDGARSVPCTPTAYGGRLAAGVRRVATARKSERKSV